jgi:hypothetical protein
VAEHGAGLRVDPVTRWYRETFCVGVALVSYFAAWLPTRRVWWAMLCETLVYLAALALVRPKRR